MHNANSPSEKETTLIRRVVTEDDHAAFGELVRLHQSPVRQFLRRLTQQDFAKADDLAQEAFWKAYRNLSGFRGEGSLRSWLFKIAYQLFVTDLRRHRKVKIAPLPEQLPAGTIEGEQVVLRQTVDAMLNRLQTEERAAILLHFRHGLTQEEVSAAMGSPLGTVKSWIRRGRQKMKDHHDSAKPLKKGEIPHE